MWPTREKQTEDEVRDMKFGATSAANKVILKLASIVRFNNEASAEGPNNKSRNCPTAEICATVVVSLSSSSLS